MPHFSVICRFRIFYKSFFFLQNSDFFTGPFFHRCYGSDKKQIFFLKPACKICEISFDFSNTTFCFHTRALSKKLHVFFFSQFFYGEPRFGMILSLRCHSTKFVNFPILATLFVWQTQEFVKFCMNALFFQKFMQLRFFNDEIRIWHLFFFPGKQNWQSFCFCWFLLPNCVPLGKRQMSYTKI